MKTFVIVLSIITGLLLFSTTVCGLWIHGQGAKLADYAGAIRFHIQIGATTAVIGMATVVATLVWAVKK